MMCFSPPKHSPTSELLLWIMSTTAASWPESLSRSPPCRCPALAVRRQGHKRQGSSITPANSGVPCTHRPLPPQATSSCLASHALPRVFVH